jgi:hypothetical protein
MVVEDLRAWPDSPLVVAEGSTLPAAAISSGEAERANALWLVSTRDFQDEQLRRRNAPPGPARGFRLLRDQIEREAREHGVPVFVVDGSRSLDETAAAADERFRVTLAAGPCASTLDERRALLREANESIDAQVRGHLARPWADGDADGSVRELFCECGEPSCEATLALPLGSLAAGPVLAPGH